MRKQTKLVAVLSATALMALGASMASFAATGWQEEDGTWVYYAKDGTRVEDEWKKSGDNWYYLDESGYMAVDTLIESGDDYYYVDENGVMVTNRWISVENEDYDEDDDEPANYWYYFQANGKAMKGSDNKVSLKTINGKKYTFDEEGRMLFGWVNEEGGRETGDDAWREGVYYFGSENDGAMTTGWLEISIIDDNASEDTKGFDADTAFTDEEQDRWFFFKPSGKKTVNETGKTINGRKYAFDEDGRMVAEWRMNADPAAEVASDSNAFDSLSTAEKSQSWRYYGSPESGARVNKGWFQVVPAEYLNSKDYDDDEANWYYSDNSGKLVANEFKTINGKKYAFDQYGAMVSGLKFITVDASNKNKIVAVHDDEWYDTEEQFNAFVNGEDYNTEDGVAPDFTGESGNITYCYYFGSESDGSLKTGTQNIDLDGETFSFLFTKSGSSKGAGKNGEDNDKYYMQGKLLRADKEDKYSVVEVRKNEEGKIIGLRVLTTDEFIKGTMSKEEVIAAGVKYDEDNVYYATLAQDAAEGTEYKLVNTSGKVVDNKTNAKDGDDFIYDVKAGKIRVVYEKN